MYRGGNHKLIGWNTQSRLEEEDCTRLCTLYIIIFEKDLEKSTRHTWSDVSCPLPFLLEYSLAAMFI